MKIEYDGEQYEYNEDELMLSQWLAIEDHIGAPVFTNYPKGLLDGSAKCYQALGWLVLHGGDRDVPIADVNFPMVKLAVPYLEGLRAQITEAMAALDADSEPAEAAAGD